MFLAWIYRIVAVIAFCPVIWLMRRDITEVIWLDFATSTNTIILVFGTVAYGCVIAGEIAMWKSRPQA